MLSAFGIVEASASVNNKKYLTIAEQGKSNYKIVVSLTASKSIYQSARELQRLISKSTNVVVPIVNRPENGYNSIFVGASHFIKERGIVFNNLEKDHYRIFAHKNDLFLFGNDDVKQPLFVINHYQTASAGTFFAVLGFARAFLNANWFMPGENGEEVAELSILQIPADTDLSDGPHFMIRYIDIASQRSFDREKRQIQKGHLSRSYFDKRSVREASRWGRYLRLGNNFQLDVAHSWRLWIPAEKPSKFVGKVYGETNPQYFARPGGNLFGDYYHGRSNSFGGQLCVCNHDLIEEYANNIISYANKTGVRSFSLSPNDGGKWDCKCSCCRSNPSQFLADTPALTEQVIKFAGAISAKVRNKIPDATFGIYGYSWISKPPEKKIDIPDNIVISDVQNGLPYLFYVEGQREKIRNNMVKWRGVAKNIVLTSYYYYYANYSLPWSTPNVHKFIMDVLANQSRSAGIRMNYSLFDVAPMGLVGGDPWVLSELLWDPNQSVAELQDRYYAGAFGSQAGKLVKEYFNLISNSMQNTLSKQTDTRQVRASNIKSFILESYLPIRKECRSLLERAKHITADKGVRYQWRLEKIYTAWRLAEITVDMLIAEERGELEKATDLFKKRRELLISDKRIFSLASSTADFEEGHTPLIKQ